MMLIINQFCADKESTKNKKNLLPNVPYRSSDHSALFYILRI